MRSPLTIFCLICVLWANAQSDQLIVRGVTGNLYLEHTVVAKETWYSLGRLYNVEPKTLARYNHRTFSHPMEIGELVKVPLSTENFSQNGKKLASETLVPVYHIVQEKEWLYRISVNHNKVAIPLLEKWNHVTGDDVHAGLHMIVGYLKVRTALSALARRKAEPAIATSEPAATHLTAASPPSSARDVSSPGSSARDAASPAPSSARDASSSSRETTPPSSLREATSSTALPASTFPSPHFDGGRFREDYNNSGHSVTGEAGVFKSTSGWQDGKYYALINDVPVGTIVRITDQSNGKSVYAKVLGQLPDMKESVGLTVRLSNAAAAELGEGQVTFGVGVSY